MASNPRPKRIIFKTETQKEPDPIKEQMHKINIRKTLSKRALISGITMGAIFYYFGLYKPKMKERRRKADWAEGYYLSGIHQSRQNSDYPETDHQK